MWLQFITYTYTTMNNINIALRLLNLQYDFLLITLNTCNTHNFLYIKQIAYYNVSMMYCLLCSVVDTSRLLAGEPVNIV